MCIKIENVQHVVNEELAAFNEKRDLNLKAHLDPIRSSVESLLQWRRTTVGFLVANIFVVGGAVYFVGGWMADVKSGIEHNEQEIARYSDVNTTPAVLNTKIEQCKADQTKTEAQLILINNKLDRLIEKSKN